MSGDVPGAPVFPRWGTGVSECCKDPRSGQPVNGDFIRGEELFKYVVQPSANSNANANADATTHTQAWFDDRVAVRARAEWTMILVTFVILILVLASFDFSQTAVKLVRDPVERLVVAKQTLEALLEVFKAVSLYNSDDQVCEQASQPAS